MKKIILGSFACFMFVCQMKLGYLSYQKPNMTMIETYNRRGCCSWHNGVCGCSGGRTVCCDGTYSGCGC
ncbi:MAG: hypothetical protein ACK5N8_08065 [Alphaproteobacteria bacterium]